MAEKFDLNAGLIAGAITGLVLSIICALFVFAAPQVAINLFTSMFHSTIPITPKAFEAVSFVTGLVVAAILGAIIAGLFVFAYNKFAK